MHIKSIHIKGQPKEKIVEHGKNCRGSKTVIGEHVGHHADLVVHRRIGPQENTKLLGDGSVTPPILEWIEDKLVATWKMKSKKILQEK